MQISLCVENMAKTNELLKIMLMFSIVLVIWIVGCLSFFEIQTSTREMIVGNQTVFVENKIVVFKDDEFESLPVTSILGPIVGASASILAIVFAISNLIISSISEKYTPHILNVYEKEAPTTKTFYSFLFISGFSIILLFAYRLVPPMASFILLISTLTSFVIALFLLMNYFFYMFKIVNPLSFGDLLKDKAAQAVERQNEQETRDYIVSLGDVSVRAFDRKEARVCMTYIRLLYDVFDKYLQLKMHQPEKYKLIANPLRSAEIRNGVLIYILDEYFRIFRYAILEKEEIVSKEIVEKLFAILHETFFAKENDDLVGQILETRYIIGAKYYRFYKIAIENRDQSRFRLVQDLVSIVQMLLFKKEKIKDDLLEQFLACHLFRLNKLVIDNDDFDLFKSEINNFSLMLPRILPEESQTDIYDNLWSTIPFILLRDKNFADELERRRAYIMHSVNHESARDFRKARVLDKDLEDYRSFLIKSLEKLEDPSYMKLLYPEGESEQLKAQMITLETSVQDISKDIEEARKRAYELYITSQICAVFFIIGAYLLFMEREKRIDSVKFIKELWYHTTPEDADSISLNKSPMTFNPFWLTCLLLYGGKGSVFGFDDFQFEDFHGITEYVNEYYLLSIDRTKGNLRVPPTSELEHLRNNGLIKELDFWYRFLDDFCSKPFTDSLLAYCDDLIQRASTFDQLLSAKKLDEKQKADVEKATEKLQNLKSWIKTSIEDFEKTKQEIVCLLPLDSGKVEKCKAEVAKSYNQSSAIFEMIKNTRPFQKTDKDLEFVSIGQRTMPQRYPKDCLIEPSSVDCSMIWSEVGRYVALGEMNCFIKKILGCMEIEKTTIEETNIEELYDKICTIVNDLRMNGFDPTVILPSEYLTKLVTSKFVAFERGSPFLRINKTKIKIILSSKYVALADILIVDKNAIIWTYKSDDGYSERLFITVQENEKDKASVIISANTMLNLKIVNPKAVKVLKIV